MCGIYLTRPMRFCVGSFPYTPHAILCGEFLLHAPCCIMLEVCLTRPIPLLCGEFLLHAPCCIMWGVSLQRPMLYCVGSFSYTPHAVLYGEFLLHAPCYFCVDFLLHGPCCIMLGVSLTRPVLLCCWEFIRPIVLLGVYLTLLILCNVGSFSYTPHAILYGRILFHATTIFMWGVSLKRPMLFFV